MIKAIGIDLDGTLLNDRKEICSENIRALRKAREAGVYIILCSGRSKDGMQKELEALDLLGEGNYAVGLNGGIAFHTHTGELLFRRLMTPASAAEAVTTGRRMRDIINTQIYDGDRVFVERFDATSVLYQEVTGARIEVIPDLMEIADHAVKLSYFLERIEDAPLEEILKKGSAAMEEILRVKAAIEKEMPGDVQAAVSAPYLAEVFDRETNKGSGMAALGEILGISLEEMMGIGDLENDRGLLEKCGIGVLMKNGTPSLLDVADYVTTLDNNQGGVAEAVERFVLSAM